MSPQSSRFALIDLDAIRLDSLSSPTDDQIKSVGKELVKAFTDIGFVYIKNHGISEEIISGAFARSREFFSLQQDVKDTFAKPSSRSHGYTAINREHIVTDDSVIELKEAFEVFSRYEAFPDILVPGFKRDVIELGDCFLNLNQRLLKAFGFGLELSNPSHLVETHPDWLDRLQDGGMRLIHYPPVPDDGKKYTRCGEHSDYDTLTMLLQDDVGGLQVQDSNGEWIDAPNIPGAILLNLGESLQILSNDKLMATPHRVLIQDDEKKRRSKVSRFSIGYFSHPADDSILSPLETDSPKYQPITSLDFLKKKFTDSYNY